MGVRGVLKKVIDVIAAILGFLLNLIGGWSLPLQVLVVFAVADYITGVIVALFGKSKKTTKGGLSSKIGLEGIMKKTGIIFVIMVAAQLEILLGFSHSMISQAIIYIFIANEGISILENTALLGVIRIPFLLKVLEQLKNQTPKLGQILLDKGAITEDQLNDALSEQDEGEEQC